MAKYASISISKETRDLLEAIAIDIAGTYPAGAKQPSISSVVDILAHKYAAEGIETA